MEKLWSKKTIVLTSLLLGGLLPLRSFALETPPENDSVANVRERHVVESRQAIYNQIYPYYLEACASSQWKPRKADMGGPLGHTFMLIRGACKDPSAVGAPQLKVCGPDSIVGISTDNEYRSVQWTVVESREFMLFGDHPADRPFDESAYKNVKKEAERRGIFKNVLVNDHNYETARKKNLSDIDWLTDYTFATDYALTLGRSASCTRIPLSGTRSETGPLTRVIAYLNQLNRKAYESLQENKLTGGYKYHYMTDNCTHPLVNSLAYLGLARGRDTTPLKDDSTSVQFSRRKDTGSPYNVMLDSYERGNNLDVARLKKRLLADPVAMNDFMNWGWLGPQHGVIIEEIKPHAYKNDIFNPNVSRDFFSVVDQLIIIANQKLPSMLQILPSLKVDAKYYERLIKKSETTDLVENLVLWKKIYKAALKDRALSANDPVDQELKKYFLLKLTEVVKASQRLNEYSITATAQ